MTQFTHEILPGVTGVTVAEGALADVYRRDPAYTEVVTEDEAEAEAAELKGKALDAELTARGLSTKGSAADKRQRLADAIATPEPPAGLPATPEPIDTAGDREAVGAVPTTQGVTLDRDADQSEEN